MAGIRILAIDRFCFPLVKFINFFAGALLATTAANVLLASDAYAFSPPNGWRQVGKFCQQTRGQQTGVSLHKLVKTGTTLYGVYNGSKREENKGWVKKDISLQEANAEMNDKCGVSTYQPT